MDSWEISVVVQGPVDPEKTKEVLNSVRRYLPKSEIVFSTWRGQNLQGLDFDILLENEDPGAILANPSSEYPVYNNLNRQIVSTCNGLKKASRKYAVKLRSDCFLTKAPEFSFSNEECRVATYSVFERPVMILNIYTRSPFRRPVLFHFSDIFMAGLRADLLKYWSVPLVVEPEFSRFMEGRRVPLIDPYPGYHYLFRCAPEQYLGECFAKKAFSFEGLKHISHGGISLFFKSLRILANNFQIVTPDQAGVRLPEKMRFHEADEDLFHPADVAGLKEFTKKRLPVSLWVSSMLRYARICFRHSRFFYFIRTLKNKMILQLK